MKVLLLHNGDGKTPVRFMKVGDEMLQQARDFHKDEILHEGDTIQECLQWLSKQVNEGKIKQHG